MTSRLWLVGVCALALLVASPAHAQVCGDADGNGSVSVSDGVQALRAAAELSSTCSAAVCDVDGNGSITVSDGVSVLRLAAELPVSGTCAPAAGQPATVLGELQPLFAYAIPFATSKPVTACANPADGTFEEFVVGAETTTSLSFCQVGNVFLDGDVVLAPGLFTVSAFAVSTVPADDPIGDYDGELTTTPSGGGLSLSGDVDVSTESSGFSLLTFASVVVVNGVLSSGTATLDLVDSDLADSFISIQLTFDGSGVADALVTQSNNSTQNFRYDLATGAVTQ